MAADETNTVQDERDEVATGADRPDQLAEDRAEGAAPAPADTTLAGPEPEETAAAEAEDGQDDVDEAADASAHDAAPEEQAPAGARSPLLFDPSDPFAVPADVLPLIQSPEPRSRRRRASSADVTQADEAEQGHPAEDDAEDRPAVTRRRRRRRRGSVDMELAGGEAGDPEDTVIRVRAPRAAAPVSLDDVQTVKGSTRLEAKRQRRRDSRSGGRRRTVITEAEFLARREAVDRKMLVRQRDQRIQIAVLEDGVLAEHFVSHTTQDSMIGNVYLGKVQNVLPSMEAAFVDIGRGRNAVLYAGEVNWDAAQLDGKPKKIENALKSGDTVLVQVTKDPVGHKGARLTSQVSLPGRYLVYVPGGSMTGISRKLPDVERARLKRILKDHLPQDAGVIVRTAAEGTSEQELQNDINRLRAQWEGIQEKASSTKVLAPELLYSEPDLTIKTVRDVFNEDFSAMIVQGEQTWDNIEAYVMYVAPHLLDRLHHWVPEDLEDEDLYTTHRVDEQLHKALERKVYLPSGGSLVIDRTEAMTVVDVNTGKFTGSGGNLEETVTKNNLEAAEEIVRQLRLRDIGGIIVIDFIDMVLESNRDLVLRRLVECLGRDRTKHQVAEVTSLGLVQMTRKRMGTGLVEVFSEVCEACAGRGIITHDHPVERSRPHGEPRGEAEGRRKKRRKGSDDAGRTAEPTAEELSEEERLRKERAAAARAALHSIAKASGHAVPEEPATAPDAQQVGPDAGAEPEGATEAAPVHSDADAEHGDAESGEDGGGRRRKRRGRRRGRGRSAEAPGGQGAEQQEREQDEAGQEGAGSASAEREPQPAEATVVAEVSSTDRPSEAPDAAAEIEPEASSRGRRGRSRSRSRRAESPAGGTAAGVEASAGAEVSPAPEPEAAPSAAVTAPEAPVREAAPADPAPVVESAEQASSAEQAPAPTRRRRGPRRATSDGLTAPSASVESAESAEPSAPAGRPSTGAAPEGEAPARQESVASAAARPTGRPAAVPPEAAATPAGGRRRRPRRAASSDGTTVEVAAPAAAEGTRFAATATEAAAKASAPVPQGAAAPVMLGVGVKAEDIVRAE